MNCVIEESSLLNVFIALEGGVLGRGEQGVEMFDSIFWHHTNFARLVGVLLWGTIITQNIFSP